MSETRFSFGKNWKQFLQDLDEDRIQGAVEGLQTLLGRETLEGTFLDVGCGSGLMSLAALKMGASRVCSFDYDQHSVQAAEMVREKFSQYADRWEIRQGSILDPEFVSSLGEFDTVYSWGVLHHTGDMWRAFENITPRVAASGSLCLAIYNHTWTSPLWYYFKWFYCKSFEPLRSILVFFVFFPRFIVRLLRGKNPVRGDRGMNLWIDARDWAGGFPYEYATFSEVADHFGQRGFALERSTKTHRTGCHEFLFSRT